MYYKRKLNPRFYLSQNEKDQGNFFNYLNFEIFVAVCHLALSFSCSVSLPISPLNACILVRLIETSLETAFF
jgi:hypothetical protein